MNLAAPPSIAPKPRIAILAGTSIGGTEKAATIYAVELARRGYPVDYLAKGGPRADYLTNHGVRLVEIAHSANAVQHYLKETQPALVHQHVPGYPTDNPLYPALATLGSRRPKIIETNIFGRLEDPRAEQWIDFRCFISAASAAQALLRAGRPMSEAFFDRQTVLYYPLTPPRQVSPTEIQQVRAELGVGHDEVLAVRIGQAGHKWARWECEAFAEARKTTPHLRLLLMEPPEPIWSDVAGGRYGQGIILRRQTSDFAWLTRLYAASDLTIHASDWGESFGYTIGEAMAAGQPIITRSTPWGDNAQVELVENGVNGYVCWSVPEMARRLEELAKKPERRRQMGVASRQRIEQLTSVEPEIDLLEEVITFCLQGKRGPKLDQRRREAFAFVRTFRQRERATSEAEDGPIIDGLNASAYACYRRSRAGGRAILNHWLRR